MDNSCLVTAGLRPAGVDSRFRQILLHPAILFEKNLYAFEWRTRLAFSRFLRRSSPVMGGESTVGVVL